ncbi:MAG: hypothetical protein ABIQ16_09955 [Polyangiaceae bacterium]
MLEHHRLVGRLKAGFVSAVLLVPSVALAGAKDKAATALANDAMQSEYAGTHFKKAEQKLKKAITLCGASACAYDVVGRLHRDLAIVYIAGLKQNGKGKAELKRALEANPDLTLDNDFATPEVRKAFKAAGGKEPKADEEPEDAVPAKKTDDDCEPGSEGCDKEPKKADDAPSAPSKFPKNWLSVHFDQDFLIYSAKDNVCASNAAGRAEVEQYACFQGGSQFGYAPGQDIAPGAGNHVSGGVGRATSRILIGFDRLLSSNVSLGLRLGFAFGGGPTTIAGAKFLPFSGELRANYWFGSDPFESSGLRPYLSLSGGVAEVDGHVAVEYYNPAGTKGTLDTWRKTGKGFAGLGFGLMIPIGSSGIIPEVRVKQMLGSSATAFDLALGYAYGF